VESTRRSYRRCIARARPGPRCRRVSPSRWNRRSEGRVASSSSRSRSRADLFCRLQTRFAGLFVGAARKLSILHEYTYTCGIKYVNTNKLDDVSLTNMSKMGSGLVPAGNVTKPLKVDDKHVAKPEEGGGHNVAHCSQCRTPFSGAPSLDSTPPSQTW